MKIKTMAKKITGKGLTLAVAESCTGGLIAHTLTNIPGSSVFFKGGVVAYANEIKSRFLKVPSTLIKTHGAVSAPVARAMAEGIRQQFKADIALATTGIAGPGGGTPQKPVGLVFIAMACAQKTVVKKCFFTGSRTAIKTQAGKTALTMLSNAT
ncbi:MAG: CinA family protein [Candidatus Omnitrophica bacterium]|nr:CinA family protein [Candidatus Omnitrophota bacterium]